VRDGIRNRSARLACQLCLITVVSLVAVSPTTPVVAETGAVPAPFVPFRFLIGRWVANDDQAGATGGFAFAFDLQNHVIVRTNYSDTPSAQGRPASRHDDLLMIYLEGGAVKASYFDSEGHVIRYVVSATPQTIVFLSDVTSGQPRYRLTYRRGRSDDTLTGTFEIAPPDKLNAFAPYLSWSARKNK
jgi:hypothetical protein